MFKRARRALLLATAGTMVLTVAVPAVSAQAYSVGNYYKLVNYSNGNCADVAGFGSSLVIEPCAQGVGTQRWLLESATGNTYKFHNQQAGGCIQDVGGTAYDELCTGGEDVQRFTLTSTSRSGYYKVADQGDGWCLTTNPELLEFDPCQQGDGEQYWELQAAS
jgi:hypothetical protein